MRTSRLLLGVLILPSFLSLAACGTEAGDQAEATGPRSRLDRGRWSVDSLVLDGTTTKAPAGAHLQIDEKKGQATGNYGCNSFSAGVTVEGDSLTVEPGAMTDMACDAQKFEDAFRQTLSGTLKVSGSEDRLTLTTRGGDVIALTVEPPAPLTGTTWTVNSLHQDDTSSSLPAGATDSAHFVIEKNGTVHGTLGCNRFRSTARIDGSLVSFGPVSATKMTCAGPAQDVEEAMLALLDGTVNYRLEHRGLTLTAADGTGVGAIVKEVTRKPERAR